MYDNACETSGAIQYDLAGEVRPGLSAWMELVKQPAAATGLTRAGASEMLLACDTGAGTYCFRPSSQPGMMVLCVLIDAATVASLRIRLETNGEVAVHDLAPAPVTFGSLDDALAHFANPDSQPNNKVPITQCLALSALGGSGPAAAADTAAYGAVFKD